MAVVEITQGRAAKPGTYVAKQTTEEYKSFRLPVNRTTELRMLFVDLETMMGHKAQAYESDSPSLTGGGLDSDVAGVSLSGSEQWCQLSTRQKSGLAKAYRTLKAISRWDWMILWRAYGPREPNAIATADFTAELAPLVRFTDVVECRRTETRDALANERIERADKVAKSLDGEWETRFSAAEARHATDALRLAHIQQILAWKAQGDPGYARNSVRGLRAEAEAIRSRWSQDGRSYPSRCTPAARQSVHDAIRRGTDAEVTRSAALDSALNPKETGDATARQAIRDARRSFISKASRQADRMLADASLAYQKMWRWGAL